jgi:hypothetical protein
MCCSKPNIRFGLERELTVNPKTVLKTSRYYPISMSILNSTSVYKHPPPFPQTIPKHRRCGIYSSVPGSFVTLMSRQLTGKLPTQWLPLYRKQEFIKQQISQLVIRMALFSRPVHFRSLCDPLLFSNIPVHLKANQAIDWK